jgi:hypothetical protein
MAETRFPKGAKANSYPTVSITASRGWRITSGLKRTFESRNPSRSILPLWH